jgi:hypothetical protein
MTNVVVSLISSSLLCVVSYHLFDFFLDEFEISLR